MAYRKELWTEVDVVCPFYVGDDVEHRAVRCEGYCDDGELISRFRTLKAREEHMGNYCTGRYERCPVYSLIYGEKYHD